MSESMRMFLSELARLLKKHNATIGFDCDGDTYGISNTHIYAELSRLDTASISPSWMVDHVDVRDALR